MKISLPQKSKYIKKEGDLFLFEIEPCFPGYGHTLGNALRRVLLSSLEGAAATTVKIVGVKHEFSTIPHVLEDTIEIILNLKELCFKMYSKEPIKLILKAKGEKEVTAKDLKCPSGLEVVNKNAHIATLTDKKAKLELEIQVEKGLGYVPREERGKEKLGVGTIALDAIFTPIKVVNYTVEDIRVGERTNYNKLVVGIKTDGSIEAKEALKQAAKILADHFNRIAEVAEKKSQKKPTKKTIIQKSKKIGKRDKIADSKKLKIEELNLPLRILKVLKVNKIKTAGGLAGKKKDFLEAIEGLGPKAVKEIQRVIGRLGLTLKK